MYKAIVTMEKDIKCRMRGNIQNAQIGAETFRI